MNLAEKALEQIKQDIEYNDFTPILELLRGLSTEQLEAYLVTTPISVNSQKYMDDTIENEPFMESMIEYLFGGKKALIKSHNKKKAA